MSSSFVGFDDSLRIAELLKRCAPDDPQAAEWIVWLEVNYLNRMAGVMTCRAQPTEPLARTIARAARSR